MSRHKNKIRRPSISSHGKIESAQIRTNENVCVSIPSKSQRKFFFISIRICFFLYMLWFWAFHCRDFIFMAQEYDLFIWDWEYLIDAGSRVTGLARWFSSFTLQFFYYPVVGGILLAVCMSFLQYAMEKLFRLKQGLFFLSFILPCLLTLQITNIGFLFFERFDLAYLFSFTNGYVFTLLYLLLFEKINNKSSSLLFIALGLILTYSVFGFFSLLASLLCVLKMLPYAISQNMNRGLQRKSSVDDLKLRKKAKDRKSDFVIIEFLMLFILLVPVFYWPLYNDAEPTFHHMYGAGLWEESPLTQGRDRETDNIFSLFTALELTLVFSIALYDVIYQLFVLQIPNKNNLKQASQKKVYGFLTLISYFLIPIICAATLYTSFSWFGYSQFLKIARELDRENWNGVLREESLIVTPSNPAITARLLALARLNKLADEVFLRPLYPDVSPQLLKVQSFGMCGDRILLELGLTNCAERVAFNNYVVKRERTYWGLKTLALCAVIDGRRSLAERYLFRMKKTLFHRKFAEETLDYLATRSIQPSSYAYYATTNLRYRTSDNRLAELDNQFNSIRNLAPLEDGLAFSETVNSAYYGMLQEEDILRHAPGEIENRLAFLLLMRNLPLFGLHFDKLVGNGQIGERIPQSFQEALLLRERFPAVFEPGASSWSIPKSLKIDPSIRDRFDAYLAVANNSSTSVSTRLATIQTEFGDTLWGFLSIPHVIDYY